MSSLTRSTPLEHLGYDTLVGPATFTQYCFPVNCATMPFSVASYSEEYTKQQEEKYELGVKRFIDSRQIMEDYTENPVFNSGMRSLPANYMHY